MKETVIIVIVIIIVIVTSFITQKYLEKTSNEILGKLTELKTQIKNAKENENTNNATKLSEEIIENWKQINTKWSMIVVHEELDNIEISLLELKACIENDELEESLKEIDKSIFLVGHIKEKESFRIKNIF